MRFRLQIDKDQEEEIIANVHESTPLIDEIEKMVLQDSITDQIPGYMDDEITMLAMKDIELFISEDDRTYAFYRDKKKYLIRKRLYEIEEIIPAGFVRISKSAIANWEKVVKLKVQLSGAVDAVFESGNVECISRRCFADKSLCVNLDDNSSADILPILISLFTYAKFP